ncbi:cytochrome P450 [Spongiactinospora sp. 9N601]|uniref:cytochrome P450 n=1 Tax=Spongiactinospora sp. 9N601 TaxID=3375149 RepID=UPI003795B3A8
MHADEAPPQFPFTALDPLEPPEEYAKMRESAAASRITLPTGDPAWLVTRYEEVRTVLADPRFSREAITAPGAPRVFPIAKGAKSIIVMDPPEHSRLRRLVSHAFSVRRMEALRPHVERRARELVAAMEAAGPPADLVAGITQPLPMLVICEMLGVPYADVDQFQAWTDLMLSFDAGRREEVIEARDRLNGYLAELIAAKRARPTDDLMMVLINARDEGDRLSEEELVAFAFTLLGAGYHATTAAMTHILLRLLREPERMRALQDRPELLPDAAEELLRLSQAGGGVGALRIATEDMTLGDVRIKAGDAVLPSVTAANRDPEVFAAPDAYDPVREPNHHITFGHGIHYCLGAQLSRIELRITLETLLGRLPRMALAVPAQELTWRTGTAFARPDRLPVTW